MRVGTPTELRSTLTGRRLENLCYWPRSMNCSHHFAVPQNMSFETNTVILVSASANDGDELADLRVRAMKDSLEAIGRFDPDRARMRFLSTFTPTDTRKILLEGKLAGFLVVRQKPDHLYLDHLYVLPEFQGQGIGRHILAEIKNSAQNLGLPIRLIAVEKSAANAFYKSNGFEMVGQKDVDIAYQWMPG